MTDPASSEIPAAAAAAATATARHDAQAITLGAATAVDAPALIGLHTAAFGADLFSHLMLLGRPPGTHEGFMRRALDAWFADPDAHIVRAVDADGAVVGWACWVRKQPAAAEEKREEGGEEEEEEEAEEQKREDQAPPVEGGQGDTAPTPPPPPPPSSSPPPPSGAEVADEGGDGDGDGATGPGALGRRMRADLVRWEAAHLGGRGRRRGAPYLVLQALATEPACQGRGIGSRLVQWGVERAEARGLACWAHASPAGHGLYARLGFEELGRSDYDLAAWAPGGRAGRRGWGVYAFRYMLRRPRGSDATATAAA